MKYQKPYFTEKEYGPTPPAPILQIGWAIFYAAFRKEVRDSKTWATEPTLSQLVIGRCMYLFFNKKHIPEIVKRSSPAIGLIEEAYTRNHNETLELFENVMNSYSSVQHRAYVREEPAISDNWVKDFNNLFDEYRFQYEELLNRLTALCYGCIDIIVGNKILSADKYISINSNKKIKNLKISILPSDIKYKNIRESISGIKPEIRNALSHGGRVIQVDEEKVFILEDATGWQKKYNFQMFKEEFNILKIVIISLEFATVIFEINHIKEFAAIQSIKQKQLTGTDKSEIIYFAGKDCQFEIIDAESKGSILEVKMKFAPVQSRESEVFINWGTIKAHQKVPAQMLDLKGQVLRFILKIYWVFDDQIPSVRLEIYDYKDVMLARGEIINARGFCNFVSDNIKSYNDFNGKAEAERKYLIWERFSWDEGEIKY
jgi:hypothetical protein